MGFLSIALIAFLMFVVPKLYEANKNAILSPDEVP